MNDTYEHDPYQQNHHNTEQPTATLHSPDLKQNLTNSNTWQRGFFMLVFLVIYFLLRFAVAGVALFQFGSLLFTGHVNVRLQQFSRSLCTYSYQLASYVTFSSDHKPFPFSTWPTD